MIIVAFIAGLYRVKWWWCLLMLPFALLIDGAMLAAPDFARNFFALSPRNWPVPSFIGYNLVMVVFAFTMGKSFGDIGRQLRRRARSRDT